jgi:sugar phosphate isomerase/epimerase
MARPIGFSTGALALDNFRAALTTLSQHAVTAVELSALRPAELEPLVRAVPDLDLTGYQYVSVHAPSKFTADEEPRITRLLHELVDRGWPVVLHPDAVHRWEMWRPFGAWLYIENMDKRKPIGRTVEELQRVYDRLPAARLCFDIAHARQYDSTMTEAYRILTAFGDRIGQVHISEVNSQSKHDRISLYALAAFRHVADLVPADVPIIVESQVAPERIASELTRALESLTPLARIAVAQVV